MTGRAKTGGVGTKARRRKGAKLKRVAKRTHASQNNPPNVDLQQQLDMQAHELAEARRQLSDALEQQAATSEVLKVVARSTIQLKPVFEMLLKNAVRLCAARFGIMFGFDGDAFEVVAMENPPLVFANYVRKRGRFLPEPEWALHRIWKTKQPVNILVDAGLPSPGPSSRLAGARSAMAAPMLKGEEVVGAIFIYRRESEKFTDKQVALLADFAAQAVIAIENARLLNELRQRTDDLSEALEQQTATSEVLRVISSSPGDLQPVFEAMLKNARVHFSPFCWCGTGQPYPLQTASTLQARPRCRSQS